MLLTYRERREIQRRLALIGFYTRGIDGDFGRGTRRAITDWQHRAGFPGTGFLDRYQLAVLVDETEEVYRDWLRRSPSWARRGRYMGADGCIREADGRVVGNQSLKCDMKGLGRALGF